jgi:hypothetical protein
MRVMYRIIGATVAVACIYLGWTYHLRQSDHQALAQRLEERKAEQARPIMDISKGRLSVLAFYTVPPTIRRGEKAQLCYGVSNSKNVRIEPPVEYVWPSYSRCVEISPASDTVYKLIADDDGGHTVTAETRVRVK